ncbi:unnamed protein product [Chrysodeixis includens]|uniref:PHD-type domain-containing protein n=1 Tax=Chrysodeixis includens TaxID=689277 RepID=A0A9N8Q0W2_CHRIL|nr:unnamed protein product [Chrysodeixis includens]
MHSVEAVVRRGAGIPLALFEKDQLAQALASARNWKRGAADMFLKKVRLCKELYPYMHSVEAVVRRGAGIPLALFEKDQLAQALASARNWKRGAADMFLKKVRLCKELYPYMHSVEAVVRRGAGIPLALFEKDQLAQALASARNWKRGAADMFLKKVRLCKELYPYMHSVEAVVRRGAGIPLALFEKDQLAQALASARNWKRGAADMFLKKVRLCKELYPYMHSVEAVVRRGAGIPLALFEKDQLAQALASARNWKRGAADMFLKKSWPYSLLEALSPRVEAGTAGAGGRRRAREAGAEAGFLRHFSEDSTPTDIVAAFKHAELQELHAIKELRTRNMRKEVRAPVSAGVTFCVCQKRQYGVMTQCELCKDWFHASCIAADKEEREESPDRVEVPFPTPEPKFLCPDCMRTKRPRLDRILALLVWLQKLPVRLAEGEALQCVTERAMAWQDAARALLASPALAALPLHDHDTVQANREKADKLNAELKKATGRAHDSHLSNPRSSASVEHAYSATPRSPSTRVAPGLLQKLEDLMLEGDLLEVRLEEQVQVWSAVVACRGLEGRRAARHDAGRRKRRTRQPRPHHQLKRTRTRHHHPADTRTPAAKPTLKRGTATTTNYLNRKQGMSSGSGLMMRKHYMARQERRKRGLAASTRGKHPRQARMAGQRGAAAGAAAAASAGGAAASSSSSASSAEDDEDCAAHDCLRPTGKLDWVQCDGGCDQWFHMHCVGLSRGALREDDDYVCGTCAQRPRD